MPDSLFPIPTVTLADCLRAAKPADLILTASNRLAREFSQRFAGNGTALLPRILPYATWLADCWQRLRVEAVLRGDQQLAGLVLLSETQEYVLWGGALRDGGAEGRLLFFERTVAACMRSHQGLQEYCLPRDHPAWRRSDESGLFLDWLSEVEAICARKGWLPRTELAGVVCSQLPALRHLQGQRVYLAGFEETSPRQDAMFQALARQAATVAIIGDLGSPVEPRLQPVAVPEAESEWWLAAEWAVAQVRAHPQGRFAVVIPELAQHHARVREIFNAAFSPSAPWSIAPSAADGFHISYAPPLSANPLAQAGLRLLPALCESPQISDLRYLLRSPWLLGAEQEREARANLEAILLRERQDYVPLALLPGLAAGKIRASSLAQWAAAVAKLIHTVEQIRAEPQRSPSAWATMLRGLWTQLLWLDRNLSSAEFQARHRALEELGAMAELDLVLPACHLQDFSIHLRRRFDAAGFQAESPMAPVLVAGLFEVSGLSFDAAWVCGLNDQTLPRPVSLDPFLPAELQRSQALPRSSPARELDFAKHTFRRLLRLAPEITLSYSRRSGEEEQEASPLLLALRLPWTEVASPQAFPSNDGTRPLVWEQFADWQGGALSEARLSLPGGVRVIADQSACPFRAFARARLESEALEWEAPLMNRMDQGSLLHRALETFWHQTKSRAALPDEDSPLLAERIASCVEQALERFVVPPGDALAAAQKQAERERLIALIAKWVSEYERAREPFEVVAVEQTRNLSMGGVQLRLRPDRVDRLPNGSLALIDYKSGVVSQSKWLGDRPEEPQLLLYLASAGKDRVGALAFASLKPGKLGWKPYGEQVPTQFLTGAKPASVTPEEGWDAFVASRGQVVNELITGFQAGFAPVDPRNPAETCRYCAQHPFCRIQEVSPATEELDSEGESA